MSNTITKGKLIVKDKAKSRFMVELSTKKGASLFSIPEKAKVFKDQDAEADIEVDVERDAKNNILKVSIPGKETVVPTTTQPPRDNRRHDRTHNNNRQGGSQRQGANHHTPVSTNSLEQGNPKLIGMPFHNPYTFIPFATNAQTPNKTKFTPRTIDESEKGRFSGVIELEITTLSPLMTNGAIPQIENGHKIYSALTIGDDVIVPATGVRGFLRNLLTIITGGPLTTVDEGTFLCQGRDLQLGSGKVNVPGYRNVYLGRVVEAGSHKKPGEIERGETRLVEIGDSKLERPDSRNPSGRIYWVDLVDNQIDPNRPQLREIRSVAETEDAKHCWRLKLSGKPVGGRNARKFEGVFKGKGDSVEVSPKIWAEYMYRNRHGDKKSLKKNDLVWLEINESNNSIISIQWARWGRRGM